MEFIKQARDELSQEEADQTKLAMYKSEGFRLYAAEKYVIENEELRENHTVM